MDFCAKRMDHVHSDIRGPLYQETLRMQQQGIKVLRLNTGNPAAFGFSMPDSVREALLENLDRAVGYCDSRGMPQARAAILCYHRGKGFDNVTDSDIFIGNGVSEIAQMVCLAALDPGDEVLMPCPNYSLWSNGAILAGARPVLYRCDEEQCWYPDLQDMENKINSRTKALLVINPNNPTGALYPREVVEKMLELARKHHLLVISDEIYDRLLLGEGQVHDSCAALAPDLPVITCNGLSKSHIICGFRCGWAVLSSRNGELDTVRDALERLCSMRLCGNVLTQVVIPAALEDEESTREMMLPGGRLYEQSKAVQEEVNRIEGLSAVPNSAAFYLFPKMDIRRFGITDDHAFGMGLLKEKHVLIVPGTGFGYPEHDHFRIVMLPEANVLREAMHKIGDYLGMLSAENARRQQG